MTGKGADQLGKKIISAAVQFFIRAVVGMALIFFINQYVIPPDSSINVGMNAVSFLTSGTLGSCAIRFCEFFTKIGGFYFGSGQIKIRRL